MNIKKLLIPLLLIAVLGIGAVLVFSYRKPPTPKPKTYHVGILSGLDLFASIADSFKAEMTNLGYVENQDITYDLQKTNFEPAKEKQILTEFVANKVDLILGYNTDVALEAKDATKGTNIPVLFANALTEGNNLVDSLRTPGGNITGVRYPNTDVAVKRLEVLHEIAPKAKRIWIPYQKDYPTVAAEMTVVRPAAQALGLNLTEFPVENLAALQAEMGRRSKTSDLGFDAVLFIPESLSTTQAAFETIAKFTRPLKIPIGGSAITTADYGTVFAVTVDNVEIGKLAAALADKILRKVEVAGTLPVVTPETHLILNSKVAAELGLPLPEGLLNQANEIIH